MNTKQNQPTRAADAPEAPQPKDRTWWTYWQYNAEIKRLEAHAERLAEALRKALSYIETLTWNADKASQKETASIREALAAWEGVK